MPKCKYCWREVEQGSRLCKYHLDKYALHDVGGIEYVDVSGYVKENGTFVDPTRRRNPRRR